MSEDKQPEKTTRNRGGRPKGSKNVRTLEIEAAAQKYASKALLALIHVATKGKSEGSRVAAAVALLDRGYGRPRQALEHSGPEGGPIETRDVADADLQKRATELVNRIAFLAPALKGNPVEWGSAPPPANGNGHKNGSNGKGA